MVIVFLVRPAELLGESDEKPFRRAADELRAVLAEPGKRFIDVAHRKHDAGMAWGVYRGVPVNRDGRRREEVREPIEGECAGRATGLQQSALRNCPALPELGQLLRHEAIDNGVNSGDHDFDCLVLRFELLRQLALPL